MAIRESVRPGRSDRVETLLGRRCCEGAIELYLARKSAYRRLGQARSLVHCLRCVREDELKMLDSVLGPLTAFGQAVRAEEEKAAAGKAGSTREPVLTAAVATTFKAQTRRKIRDSLGSWFTVRLGMMPCQIRDGHLCAPRAGLVAHDQSSAGHVSRRELESLLETMKKLAEETREREQELDLRGFGLLPSDCSRFGLREEMRYQKLLSSVDGLGRLLNRRLG